MSFTDSPRDLDQVFTQIASDLQNRPSVPALFPDITTQLPPQRSETCLASQHNPRQKDRLAGSATVTEGSVVLESNSPQPHIKMHTQIP
jgi:hypothetical protein